MRRPLIDADIPITGHLRMLFFDAGLQPVMLYRNGSIPAEVVLTVKGSTRAFIAGSVEDAIKKAEAEIYGGL
jgi:hypothetical protein